MNPVLRENLAVFFGEGHGLPVYACLLLVLGPVEFLLLCTPFLGTQMWSGSGNLLRFCAGLAMLLVVYFALRVANREYASSRFETAGHWLRDRGFPAGVVARGQLAFLAVHVACSIVLIAPLLAWAAAISHAPAAVLAATLGLVAFHALCYGVWGLAALALWESEPESRELMVRCFTITVVVVAMLVYLPLNPVAYVFAVAGGQAPASLGLAAGVLTPDAAHFAFHAGFGGAGLLLHRWALGRGR